MIRFGDKESCKLVELYRAHECLWNPSDEYYRNKRKSLAACETIAREMDLEGFTAADVKTKLKNLRGTYNQELIKIRKCIQAGDTNFVSNLKWFYIMDSFIKKLKSPQPPEDSTSEDAVHAPDGIFLEESQWELFENNSEDASGVENEQSIRFPSDTEIITVADTPTNQSASNSKIFTVMPEYQNTQPVSHTQIITVTPEVLTVKAVSTPETVPVTSKIKCVEFSSKSKGVAVTREALHRTKPASVSTVPSGIQTVKSASNNKRFALMSETPISKTVSNHNYAALSPKEKQNIKYVEGPQVITLSPELQRNNKQNSINESLGTRKRLFDEVSSTNSNNEIPKISNTGSVANNVSDQSEDEMIAFGHFVALNLKKMSMHSALSAQSEILSVLTRYRLNNSALDISTNGSVYFNNC